MDSTDFWEIKSFNKIRPFQYCVYITCYQFFSLLSLLVSVSDPLYVIASNNTNGNNNTEKKSIIFCGFHKEDNVKRDLI